MLLINAKILLDQAWGIYKKRLRVFLGIMAFPIFASLLLTAFLLLDVSLLRAHSAFFNMLGLGILILSGFLTLGVIVIQLWSQIALLYAIKDREENIGIKESYRRGWSKIISYFWVSFLSGIIIAGGTFLFFVPGLIFFIWFSLASFVFISENKKGWAALAASKDYVKGNWRAVFWRFLFIGIIAYLFLYLFNALAVFTDTLVIDKIYIYIGYALLTPMVTIYSFLIYENLKKIHSSDLVVQSVELKK
ncbi:MAG: hypothetical protein UT90_C0006G0009 [Parcubacteria group bacterium GW2011_GWA1_40_21]|nr:MAG: hypothetical protein UT90_C0006G0009 [Parcubacteria group bacterium GW2011_GWA1_40_21]